jgi:hypothetical protein
MREGIRVREVSNEEGNRLLRIVRRSLGSVVTRRRAQMILLSAQGMDVAEWVTFTSRDRVREVLHNFNDDGFDSLYPRYKGGRPPTFTLAQRSEIIAPVAAQRSGSPSPPGVSPSSPTSSCERGGRGTSATRASGSSSERMVSFQAIKTWKISTVGSGDFAFLRASQSVCPGQGPFTRQDLRM